MGMIFNSANTLIILELLHKRYGKDNFSKVNGAKGDAKDLGPGGKTHDKAKGKGIKLAGTDDLKWEKWCDNMDLGGNGQAILNAMIMYLSDPNCGAIEFYVIQANSVTVTPIPATPQMTPYYGVILIQTPTFDGTTGWIRRTHKIHPKQ